MLVGPLHGKPCYALIRPRALRYLVFAILSSLFGLFLLLGLSCYLALTVLSTTAS